MQSIQSESLSSASDFKIITSIHFNDWLNEQYLSLAFTTYQAGKIFEPVVFCPGYLRGCAFYKNYAL